MSTLGMLSTCGDTMSTSGGYHRDVQYTGGYHDACGGYHDYIVRCSVHREVFGTSGDTMSTSGGYHEYI